MAEVLLAHVEGARMRTVIILAAGMGKRMKSDLPKVLHPVLGRTLLGHVLAAVDAALPGSRVLVVIGRGAERVAEHTKVVSPHAGTVLQEQQNGTGHAVRVALEAVPEEAGSIVVLNGDLPMITPDTLKALVESHEAAKAGCTLLTAAVAAPGGAGRIVRKEDGSVARIVERRDASPEELAINEINAGAYAFDGGALREMLGKISTHNDQGEEYLTDVAGLMVDGGLPVRAHRTDDPDETMGANDRGELATLRAVMRGRINAHWMRQGAGIVDPATTWIDVTASVEPDVTIEPNTHLRGATTVAKGARVGPDTSLIDTTVGEGATVVRAHAVEAEIGAGANVGPYAYLRPGTVLGRTAKVGTFVETKNAKLGEGAKVPHLSYIGDATVGEHSNVGAATVTVNYDGVRKHHTVIGAHARTGADNMFVAPVEVGDGAYTAAGSVIVDDVPPGALGIARGVQRNIEGWVATRRPGTAAAKAAETAEAAANDATGPHEQQTG
jgi:bifunctional UDP-N-acetylglucosamine pyrophosphorylase/glucosamine-1-phosphate N-acetyltransferase